MFLKLTDMTSNGSRNNRVQEQYCCSTSLCLASDKVIKTHAEELHFHWGVDINGNRTLMTTRFGKKRKAGVCLLLPLNLVP